MNPIKTMVLLISMSLIGGLAWAADSTPNQGILTSVSGTVKVKTKKSHKTKTAKKEMTVFEGDRIITGDDGKATLRLFDGSSLDISPKTDFVLSKIRKSNDNGKTLSFKLIVGQLLAAVEKLTTANSSFEIEAGGVVCGVRGTRFSMQCDGKPNPQVQLHVFEGIVYTIDGHGNKYFFRPGPPVKFVNATTTTPPSQQQPPPPGNNDNDSKGLNDMSNQFHSNVDLNQNKQINQSQSNIITVKPYVGN